MYITTKKIAKKYTITKEIIEKTMNKYTLQCCNAMRGLFDLGFSDTPYSVDDIEFKTAVIEEYPEELHLFVKPLSAKMSFSLETLRYVIVATENMELRTVLGYYISYLEAVENLNICDNIFKTLKFKRTGTTDLNVKVIVSEGIKDRTKVAILPEFLIESGYGRVEKISLGSGIINQLCKEIGLSEEEIEQHRQSGMPFFIEGVSAQEEIDLADSIVHADIPLKGKYGGKLLDIMIKYYSTHFYSSSTLSTVQLSFDRRIYIDATNATCEYLSSIRDDIYNKGGKELYITNKYVYYQFPDSKEETMPEELNIGGYCNLSETTDILYGLQGIFSSDPVGLPMFVNNYGIVYLMPNAEYKEYTREDLYKEYDCDNEKELKEIIRKFSGNECTVELVLAILYARCGENCYKISDCMRSLSVSAYQECCKEAIGIIRYTFNLL